MYLSFKGVNRIHVVFLSIWMYVMSCVRLSARPTGRPPCVKKQKQKQKPTEQPDFHVGLFELSRWTLHANFSFFSYLPCFKHHWLLSFYTTFTDLTLAGGHKVSAKPYLLASFSRTIFNWSGWNLIWCWSNSSWTAWCYFWMRFSEKREITTVLPTASNNCIVGMHSDVYESIVIRW